MRNEADVKKKVKLILCELETWWYMPVQTGYGVKGIPDFVCCVNGHFIGIETKFGKNTTSKWQDAQIQAIQEARGTCFIINEKNVDELPKLLAEFI